MKRVTILQLCSVLAIVNSEAGAQSLRVRFPGPAHVKQLPASVEGLGGRFDPYPIAGQKPQPPFELPSIGEIRIAYSSPLTISAALEFIHEIAEPQLNYAPALQEANVNSAIIVNAPPALQVSTQLTTPPREHMITLRPQSQIFTTNRAPPQPALYLTVPNVKRIKEFRPKHFQNQSSDFYSKSQLTPPRVQREKEFRPSYDPLRPQRPMKFSRPLPSSIFETSNGNGQSRRPRPLSTNIFSV
ncbi:uncharacterized protein LOC119643898 [Glossina fuscipes]|uniref:Uncharacterized protein LOC119643898 n=1 Tax=Glossina fuscipes TaxID=7396 RepID=A0A9C5ZF68_9MUSC|nr:uncharacterized protein LOC119643898 [Glossina fuscipes]